MHFSLFDYQDTAARDVLAKLVTARDIYRDPKYNKRTAFALSAVTGAGKTVRCDWSTEQKMAGRTARVRGGCSSRYRAFLAALACGELFRPFVQSRQ